MLGHKVNLGKFKIIEIISSILSPQHYEIKGKLQGKNSKTHVAVKQYATKQPMDHWLNLRGKKKNTKNLDTNENKSTMVQNLWDPTKAVLRGNLL